METLTHLGLPLTLALCLALAFVSAILPWVNAELLVLSLPAVAHSPLELASLVVVASTGQMAGKCLIYGAARRAGGVPGTPFSRTLERWRHRVTARASSPIGFVALSSLVGVPPFYVMSVLAGALKVDFTSFVVAGACGRLIRFGLLAFAPQLVLRTLGT
jgi:membrane protein YqaA with SNARE-associated domain